MDDLALKKVLLGDYGSDGWYKLCFDLCHLCYSKNRSVFEKYWLEIVVVKNGKSFA